MRALKKSKDYLNVIRNLSASHEVKFLNTKNSPPHKHLIKLNNSEDCNQPYGISCEQETLITKGSEEARLKFHETLLFLFLKRCRGEKLPEAMTIAEYVDLMNQGSSEKKDKLLNMYCERSNDETILEEKSREHPLNYMDSSNNVNQNSLFFHHFPKSEQICLYDCFLGEGLMFGQQVVFDGSFDSDMDELGIKSVASNIISCIRLNCRERRPFGIHLCNTVGHSSLLRYMRSIDPTICNIPIAIHSDSYFDLFERLLKERIVYLTPHARKMVEYHADDVYIFGAVSEEQQLLTLQKAYSEGVRYAAIPGGFRQMIRASKALPLFSAFKMLLSRKNIESWEDKSKFRKIMKIT